MKTSVKAALVVALCRRDIRSLGFLVLLILAVVMPFGQVSRAQTATCEIPSASLGAGATHLAPMFGIFQSLSQSLQVSWQTAHDHCCKEKRKQYIKEKYWGKPITGFGDLNGNEIPNCIQRLFKMYVQDEMNNIIKKYYNDHENLGDFYDHISLLTNKLSLSEEEISCKEYDIYNRSIIEAKEKT